MAYMRDKDTARVIDKTDRQIAVAHAILRRKAPALLTAQLESALPYRFALTRSNIAGSQGRRFHFSRRVRDY